MAALAEIRCDDRQPTLYVMDLSLRLVRGKVYQVSRDIAEGSSDLWVLHRRGFVSVKWIERDITMKKGTPSFAPPFVGLSRSRKKRGNRMSSDNLEGTNKPSNSDDLDIESIIARVRNETANQMATQVAEMKKALVEELRSVLADSQKPNDPIPLPADLGSIIASAVQQAVGNISVVGGTVSVEDDTPVFIPSKILGSEETLGTVEIEVQASSSGSGSVEDAAEALKALKRKKKK